MRVISKTLYILTFSIINHFLYAQYPADHSPYQSIPVPSVPALPGYGQSVIDNSVPDPIQITRITEVYNYVDSNGDPQVWYPTHEYSKTQVWNADQSLYKIRSWKVYDATTYQEVQDISSQALYPVYWSNINPDLLWSFREDGTIKKHFISTNTNQIVGVITNPSGNAYEYVKLGPGEGNIDKNDHYVALVGKDGQDMDVIIYDLQNLRTVTIKKFPGCWQNGGSNFPHYVDWVSVSQSGNYVVIMWDHNTTSASNPYMENGQSHYGVEVYNTTNMQYLHRLIHYGNHGDLGYAADGDEVLVQFYGVQQNGLYMYKLNGSGSTAIIQHPDFGVDGHVSCRNINRPGWAYITHADAAQSGQMIAVKLDNSGTVEYFGHHFSSNSDYEQSPMATVSPNGDLLCFKSDFGTAPNSNPSVAYSFFARLAPNAVIDKQTHSSVKLYPNPAQHYVQINSSDKIQELFIYNASGQMIKKIDAFSANEIIIDTQDWTSGIYIFKLILKDRTTLKKILINK